jgi:hypothetical protein
MMKASEMNNSKEELFRKFLDGELNNEQERKALLMIADDDDLREMLRFERSLLRSFSEEPDPASFTVPESFSDAVMSQIESGKETRTKIDSEKKTPVYNLFSARKVTLNPVYAAAAVILLSIGFGWLFSLQQQDSHIAFSGELDTSTELVSYNDSEIWIRFVYFDEDAESIEVAGDFSDWDPVALSREYVGDKQVWTGLIPMNRGEHRYMFVRDGEEWITDPLAAVQQDDGFGNKNAVLYL